MLLLLLLVMLVVVVVVVVVLVVLVLLIDVVVVGAGAGVVGVIGAVAVFPRNGDFVLRALPWCCDGGRRHLALRSKQGLCCAGLWDPRSDALRLNEKGSRRLEERQINTQTDR